MAIYKGLTNIAKIGVVKRTGDEWSVYTKSFKISKLPEFAAIRADSQGTCGIYINGELVEVSQGRFYNRVTYVECTSLLKEGENELRFVLGGHYNQPVVKSFREALRSQFSYVAAELEMISGKKRTTITTDTSFACVSDEGEATPECFSEVTKDEYEQFWKRAALWHEPKPIDVPETVAEVTGEAYKEYVSRPIEKYKVPERIHSVNGMEICEDGSVKTTGEKTEGVPYVIYDLGKLYVGYMEIEYEAEEDGNVTIKTDFTENVSDFDDNTPIGPMQHTNLIMPVKKGKNTLTVLRRRGGKYIQIRANGGLSLKINSVRVRISMMPYTKLGWFNSDDEVYNKIWEVSRYTLQVNKHREYESCPRNEMKYFSGDGTIDQLVDMYVFGDDSLFEQSMSLTEKKGDGGIITDKFEKETGLWDFPGWRIVSAYNHYRHTGDTALIKRHYDELKTATEWMINKMNSRYLIYQYPIYCGGLNSGLTSVEFSCRDDRLGEKPYMNAVFYASLVRMAELGKIVKDPDYREWEKLAPKVKKAINERLWDEKTGAYMDIYEPTYIPQDGNAVALWAGIPDAKKASKLRETIFKNNWSEYGSALMNRRFEGEYLFDVAHRDNRAISCFTNTFEAEGRFLSGDAKGALDLMKRTWGTMLKKGAQTFWEYAPNDDHNRWKICAHAWASGCAYLLGAYVLGITPEKEGYKAVKFAPSAEFEGDFSGVVPTVKGLIAVKCETKDGTKNYTLAVPKGVKLKTELPKGAKLTVKEY